jgi:ADP-ribose pyrophosphatase YjhB (NUDIX family)
MFTGFTNYCGYSAKSNLQVQVEDLMDPKWLEWAKSLQTMAQTGLTYAKDPYDIARYEIIRAMAAEMMATQTDADFTYIKDLFLQEEGYATPKVDVRAATFRDDTVLLVKERSDGLWTLPGGWADVGEGPSTATEREVREESGYEVRATRLLALYDKAQHDHPPSPYYAYTVYFDCELIGGTPSGSIETDGVDFFAVNDLPSLSLIRVTPKLITRLFELHQNPNWPTDFD